MSPGLAQTYRERAQACFGVALILGLLGAGVGASGTHMLAAMLLGIGCVGFLVAFGVIWDMQTVSPDEPRMPLGKALLMLAPMTLALILATFSLAGYLPPVTAPAAVLAAMCIRGLTRNL